MTIRYYLYKGDRPSDGGRALIEALQGVQLRSSGSAYRGGRSKAFINWGCTNSEAARLYNLSTLRLNDPMAIAAATNKLIALGRLAETGVPHVPFWTQENIQQAYAAVDNGARVYARTQLTGHSGAGIRLIMSERDPQWAEAANNPFGRWTVNSEGGTRESLETFRQAFSRCQLFTQGITGQRYEWRVHVFRDRPILTQLKLRREGFRDTDNYTSLVRNHGTGWVYSVNFDRNHYATESVEELAIQAINALGLDFGAVDIIQKRTSGSPAYVLEVNTAPGLEEGGSSLPAYANAIREWANAAVQASA